MAYEGAGYQRPIDGLDSGFEQEGDYTQNRMGPDGYTVHAQPELNVRTGAAITTYVHVQRSDEPQQPAGNHATAQTGSQYVQSSSFAQCHEQQPAGNHTTVQGSVQYGHSSPSVQAHDKAQQPAGNHATVQTGGQYAHSSSFMPVQQEPWRTEDDNALSGQQASPYGCAGTTEDILLQSH